MSLFGVVMAAAFHRAAAPHGLSDTLDVMQKQPWTVLEFIGATGNTPLAGAAAAAAALAAGAVVVARTGASGVPRSVQSGQ